MIHTMKLQEKYFNYIKNGTKEYEIRLNDEKRRNIKKCDFVLFQKEPLLKESIIVKIDDILYYDNFYELLNNISTELLADSSITKESLYKDLEKFYPIEKQKEYGVVAIKLCKNIIINNSSINDIPSDNKIFNDIRNSYESFDIWLNKMKDDNVDIYYTEMNNDITSIMILKINETDSQQFLEKGNILKIRTFFVNNTKKGIGKMYLDIVDDIASNNNIDYIYLTLKESNTRLINYFEKNGYRKYKKYDDEFVYYKTK